MRLVILTTLFLIPLFGFASFPIELDFQSSDTIIRNGKIYVDVGVDSLSKYPVKKETLTEYRERLKKQLNKNNSSNNSSYSKKSINWTAIIITWLVIGALITVLILRWIWKTFNNSDNSNGYLW